MAWQRVDGRPVDQGFRYAAAECRGRAENYEEAAVEAMKRCMYRRGYVWTAVYTGYTATSNGYNGNGSTATRATATAATATTTTTSLADESALLARSGR